MELQMRAIDGEVTDASVGDVVGVTGCDANQASLRSDVDYLHTCRANVHEKGSVVFEYEGGGVGIAGGGEASWWLADCHRGEEGEREVVGIDSSIL